MNNTLAALQENLELTKRLMWGCLFLAILQLLFGGYAYLEVTGKGVFTLIRNHFDYVGMIIFAILSVLALIVGFTAEALDETNQKTLGRKAFLLAGGFSGFSTSFMIIQGTRHVRIESYLAVSLLVGAALFLILVGAFCFLIREVRSKIASFT